MSEEKQRREWLQETIDSLEIQITLAETTGDNSVSITLARAKVFWGICEILMKMNNGELFFSEYGAKMKGGE